jgi:uncharacterized membrane protein
MIRRMSKNRLETFSDGVVAILITIMVLELRVPEGHDWASLLRESRSGLLTYLLSFVFLGIYWNNHHHMLFVCRRVTAGVLWANMHLLFWLSLVPFATAWMEESKFDGVPTAAYGGVLLLCAIAFTILLTVIIRQHSPDSALVQVVGNNMKGKISLLLNALTIPLALWVSPAAAVSLFVITAGIWLIPDRRIERALEQR